MGEEAEETKEEVEEEVKEIDKKSTPELTREDVEWIKKQRSQPAVIASEANPPTIQKVEVMTVSDEKIEAPLTETDKTKVKPVLKQKSKAKRPSKRLW